MTASLVVNFATTAHLTTCSIVRDGQLVLTVLAWADDRWEILNAPQRFYRHFPAQTLRQRLEELGATDASTLTAEIQTQLTR